MIVHNDKSQTVMCCRNTSIDCQGSNCSAWHYIWEKVSVNEGGGSVSASIRTNYGYCGLAGVPANQVGEIE